MNRKRPLPLQREIRKGHHSKFPIPGAENIIIQVDATRDDHTVLVEMEGTLNGGAILYKLIPKLEECDEALNVNWMPDRRGTTLRIRIPFSDEATAFDGFLGKIAVTLNAVTADNLELEKIKGPRVLIGLPPSGAGPRERG